LGLQGWPQIHANESAPGSSRDASGSLPSPNRQWPAIQVFIPISLKTAADSIALNQLEREITPYVWAHPDKDDRR
jgi:hypothetical protein